MKRFPLLLAVMVCLWAAGCTDMPARHTRADFLKIIDRPRVPLTAEAHQVPTTNGLVEFHFSFATEEGQRVPGILVRSTNWSGRRPVVIALHGTGGTKEGMVRMCDELATNGFIAVAIDGRYHGERAKAGKGTAEYEAAIFRAYYDGHEHPFYYDTVWDVMRLVDYLQSRPDVSAQRIGLIGISKGGIETYLAAAADKRIAVAVPCIGVESFKWALDRDAWQGRIGTIQHAFDEVAKVEGVTNVTSAFVQKFYDRVVPGIYGEFDGPSMLPLITPRPLLVINSDSDNHTPLGGVQWCLEAAERSYMAAKAENNLAVRIQGKTGHKVNPDSERAAVEWFVKWLKP